MTNLALQQMDYDEIKKILLTGDTNWLVTWKRNPPTASHMGGVWNGKSDPFVP